MGLGASDFEFGVDPSADPELALVSNLQMCVKCQQTFYTSTQDKYWLRCTDLREKFDGYFIAKIPICYEENIALINT